MQFKAGDRVKVEYEGTVKASSLMGSDYLWVIAEDGEGYSPNVSMVTLVERPESYEAGELYKSRGGHVYEYLGGTGDEAWKLVKSGHNGFRSSHGNNYRFTMPTRPLTKLVPETTS